MSLGRIRTDSQIYGTILGQKSGTLEHRPTLLETYLLSFITAYVPKFIYRAGFLIEYLVYRLILSLLSIRMPVDTNLYVSCLATTTEP